MGIQRLEIPSRFSKECECGRGGDRFSWFGRLFSNFSNRRCVGELVVLSSLFRLALIWKISIFEKSNLKTAPFDPGGFQHVNSNVVLISAGEP